MQVRLPGLDFFKKKENKEYFLALLLKDEEITAVVFEEVAGKMEFVGKGHQTFTSSLERLPLEELLDLTDKAISKAEEQLPPNIQSHKTIFGVKENWVENTAIKKDYLANLKKLCEELDLQPIGFLVFSEAIAHLLQTDEGAPVSAILVDAGDNHANLTLLRAGRVIESHTLPIDETLLVTVEKGLHAFENAEILPSRIILTGRGVDEHASQTFISHSWSKSLPFLHVPQITILEGDFEARAILFGTATQLGFEVTTLKKRQRSTPNAEPTRNNQQETNETPLRQGFEGQAKETEEIKGKPVIANEMKQSHEEDEIAMSPAALPPEADRRNDEVKEEPEPKDFFGFSQKDVGQEKNFSEIPEEVKEETTGEMSHKENVALYAQLILKGLKQTTRAIVKVAKTFKMPTTLPKQLPKNKIIFIAPVILLLILAGILWYIFGLKAVATLSLTPKNVDASVDMTFALSGQSDFGKNILAGQTVSVSEDGSASENATGTKDTGTQATGKVTLYNKLTNPITLDKGTTITSPNGLKFTLDNAVTVASASSSGSSDPTQPTTITPGTQDASVTAANFGTEYNLPSATTFTLGSGNTLAAKNASAFSGGTKKQVTVVSSDDIKKLQDDVTKSLEQKAKDDSAKQVDGNKAILSVFVKEDLTKKQFDKKVGDEAKSVHLDGTVTFTSVAYDKNEFTSFAKNLIQSQLPSDMTLSSNGLQTEISNVLAKDNTTVTAHAKVTAGLLPMLNTKQIAQLIAGKSFSQAQSLLQNTPQLAGSTIKLSPNLFFLPKTLPRMSSHISILITTND